jgi:hypothetical protein
MVFVCIADIPGGFDDILSGITGDGSLDLGALEDIATDLENKLKDCDTEKISSLAQTCGNAISGEMRSCPDECKAFYDALGEGGCGEFYDTLGLNNIEKICDDGNINPEEVFSGVNVPDTPSDTPMTASPQETPASTTTTSPAAATDTVSTPGSSGAALSSAMLLAGGVALFV